MNELPDAQIKTLDCLRIDTDWQGTAFWIVPDSVLEFARKIIAADRALCQAGPAERKLQKVLQTLNSNGFEPVQPAKGLFVELAASHGTEFVAEIAGVVAQPAADRALRQAEQEPKPVAWQQRCLCPTFGPGPWNPCDDNSRRLLAGRADYETRPLFIAPIAQPVQPAPPGQA